jgi:two-component system response regulator PilR (NtrC family)
MARAAPASQLASRAGLATAGRMARQTFLLRTAHRPMLGSPSRRPRQPRRILRTHPPDRAARCRQRQPVRDVPAGPARDGGAAAHRKARGHGPHVGGRGARDPQPAGRHRPGQRPADGRPADPAQKQLSADGASRTRSAWRRSSTRCSTSRASSTSRRALPRGAGAGRHAVAAGLPRLGAPAPACGASACRCAGGPRGSSVVSSTPSTCAACWSTCWTTRCATQAGGPARSGVQRPRSATGAGPACGVERRPAAGGKPCERHLFEPFFSSESRSSGLGLYICRELCERHGAQIGTSVRERPRRTVEGNEFFVAVSAPPARRAPRHRPFATIGLNCLMSATPHAPCPGRRRRARPAHALRADAAARGLPGRGGRHLAEAPSSWSARSFDAVITDMRLPDGLGWSCCAAWRQQRPERCIVMTAYGSAENAVEALKAVPSTTSPSRWTSSSSAPWWLGRQARGRPPPRPAPRATPGRHASRGNAAAGALERLVGESQAMRAVKAAHRQGGAQHGAGAGARRIGHRQGTGGARPPCLQPPRRRPFVAVNCGAIPENLLEAEFFGARKGSYTGATQDREGFFQAARAARCSWTRSATCRWPCSPSCCAPSRSGRCGRWASTQEDCRWTCASSAPPTRTWRPMCRPAASGRTFLPPERDRDRGAAAARAPEDLPALCEALLARIAQESGMPVPVLSPAVLEQLACRPLAGNVRELENLLHRAVALSDGDDCRWTLRPTQAPRRHAGRRSGARRWQTPLPVAASPSRAPPGRRACGPASVAGPAGARDPGAGAARDSGFNRTAAAQRLGLSCARSATASRGWASPCRAATSPMSPADATDCGDCGVTAGMPLRAAAFPQCGRTACRRHHRPDRGALHQPAAWPVWGGPGAAAVHQHAWTGRPILTSGRSRAAGVVALLHPPRRRAVAVRQLRRTGLACRHIALPGSRQLQRRLCRHRARRPGRRPVRGRHSTKRWPGCVPRLRSATRLPTWQGHEHMSPGRKQDPGPGFDWQRLQRRAGLASHFFPESVHLRAGD